MLLLHTPINDDDDAIHNVCANLTLLLVAVRGPHHTRAQRTYTHTVVKIHNFPQSSSSRLIRGFVDDFWQSQKAEYRDIRTGTAGSSTTGGREEKEENMTLVKMNQLKPNR